ncbi:hypothetical protein [Candidatus Synechococcus spongiarum]|uniref:Modification methylase NspV n=1 Tax=Candidatus Synechococcus spongiarum TaxID=431041 RepID=A0A164Y3F9_9SYNE|nr:hypothetical protein [Candidatus Synechococcus spongiarum]SAY38793.1 modification methylase NspV [Candidatus Synechococcus spongiarum]
MFDSLEDLEPTGTVGHHDGMLIAGVDAFMARRHLLGCNGNYVWRSGIKHDCAKVMDLTCSRNGGLVNGPGKVVEVEDTCLFPMLKSSDVAKGKPCSNRMMIIPQQEIGEDTSHIHPTSSGVHPAVGLLRAYGEQLDGRRSLIYLWQAPLLRLRRR